jgi:hypothetical protein
MIPQEFIEPFTGKAGHDSTLDRIEILRAIDILNSFVLNQRQTDHRQYLR